jgi:hypothetical protein
LRARSAALIAVAVFASSGFARAEEGPTCADHAERAQELRDAAKLVEARELFVACAQKECPKTVRDSCAEWLADVERRVPRVVVNARDANGRDVANVRATIDGVALPASIGVTAVRVDPGPHVMRYEAEGFPPVDDRVVLREGEGVRVLAVTFHAEDKETTRGATGVKPTTLTWVLGGVAVVSLGVFAGFGIKGVSDYRRLERDCSPRCSQAELDGVRDTFVVADVGLFVGLLAAGGATATLLLGGSGSNAAGR